LDTLAGRIESLSGRDQTGLDATRQQLDALTSRLAAIESNAVNLDALTKRLNRIARLQEASFALTSGRPIGDLPNAPEALARYAHAAPPTETQLRLRFQRDKQAALAAKQTDDTDAPFAGRVWERAQGLITIRRGDDVVVGNPSAVALNHAESALDAGDLTSAVTAVETLKGAPGQAMANWLADAKALLSARSALADTADQP
jgi:biotin carboxyl carrier protein